MATFPWDTPPRAASPPPPQIPDLSNPDPNQQLPPMFDPSSQTLAFSPFDAPKGFAGSSLNTQAAQQRAASLLREKYGTQATASIAAGMAQQPSSQPGQQSQDEPLPSPYTIDTKPGQAEPGVRQPFSTVVNQTPAQIPAESQEVPLSKPPEQAVTQDPATEDKPVDQPTTQHNPSQTDGPADGEWDQYLGQGAGETSKADQTLCSMIQQASDETVSGLMTSLQNQQRRRRSKKQKETVSPSQSQQRRQDRSVGQLDGEYDDDDLVDDDDRIGSELDDDDDPVQDDEMDSFVVCTYEKVNRIKTKWKADLLDGIIKTDGKK